MPRARIDLGHGVTAEFIAYRDIDQAGLLIYHARADNGEPCVGTVLFDIPELRAACPGKDVWQVGSLNPLDLSPSVLCSCGHHGFIRSGHWIPA